jgi:hypothetical protein
MKAEENIRDDHAIIVYDLLCRKTLKNIFHQVTSFLSGNMYRHKHGEWDTVVFSVG